MDKILPFSPRFFYPWEDFYGDIKSTVKSKQINPKHCSQLIFFTLVHCNIFKNRKDSFSITPADIYLNTNDYCFPLIHYSNSIVLKDFKSIQELNE